MIFRIEKENDYYKIIKFTSNGGQENQEPDKFQNIVDAKQYLEQKHPKYIINWEENDQYTIGTQMIRCLYCNKLEIKPDGLGEHVLPQSIGSPFHTKLISKKCNDLSNEAIDKHFNTSDIIKFLLTYVGVLDRLVIAKSYTKEIGNMKYPYRIELIKDEIHFTPLNSSISYPPNNPNICITDFLDTKMEINIVIKLMMKSLLGFTSYICEGFRNTSVANEMYNIAFNNITKTNLIFNLEYNNLNFNLVDNKLTIIIPEKLKELQGNPKDNLANKGLWNHKYAIIGNDNHISLILTLFSGYFEMLVKIEKGTAEYDLLKPIADKIIYIEPKELYMENISISKELHFDINRNKDL